MDNLKFKDCYQNDSLKIQGVYEIFCLINSKRYIGCSVNIKNRILRHLSEFKTNSHNNKHLSRAFKKYGLDNFKVSVLYTNEKYDLVLKKEIELIKQFKSYDHAFGFNILIEGFSRKGIILTEKHKQKIGNTLRGIKRGKQTNPNQNHVQNCIKSCGKSYDLISPNGERHLGKGIIDFAKQHNLSREGISRVMSGKLKTSGGWRKY